MRKPELDEPPALELRKDEFITQVREYRLITPLFGGGVTPNDPDPVTVVRGSEIRGHLRFWWRATQGGRFNGSLSKMKKAEDKLWGAVSTSKKSRPSQTQIRIVRAAIGERDSPFEVIRNKKGKVQVLSRRNSSVPAYAAFPLQPPQKEAIPGMETLSVVTDVTFVMAISFPSESQKEMEAALWAWETFGGLGARTRRGFGALSRTDINLPEAGLVKQQLARDIQQHVIEGRWPDSVPHLSHIMMLKVTKQSSDPIASWHYLINGLQDFRQDRDGRFGPTFWPEPNAIRSFFLGQPKHDRPLIKKFPRAHFGLPILFHFPQERELEDGTLLGVNGVERLASPLILRPIACTNNEAVGIAIVLDTPREPPSGLELKSDSTSYSVGAQLNSDQAKKIRPLKGETDVLRAFLDTLEEI